MFYTIKASKDFGIDHLSSYFIKQAIPYIENSLAFIFNTSIETSVFPDMWKIARITPIFKDSDKTDKSNYRPIWVLPVLSRVFQKLVYNQLYKYLEENCFLSFTPRYLYVLSWSSSFTTVLAILNSR